MGSDSCMGLVHTPSPRRLGLPSRGSGGGYPAAGHTRTPTVEKKTRFWNTPGGDVDDAIPHIAPRGILSRDRRNEGPGGLSPRYG